MKAALLCIALAAGPALADEPEPVRWTVGAHLYTQHFSPSQGFNNYNPGLYVIRNDWIVGAYYNSERNTSVYAGYVFRKVFGTPFDVVAGAVTGYERNPVMPLLVPSIEWRGVRLSLLLPFEKNGGGLHFSYEFNL